MSEMGVASGALVAILVCVPGMGVASGTLVAIWASVPGMGVASGVLVAIYRCTCACQRLVLHQELW